MNKRTRNRFLNTAIVFFIVLIVVSGIWIYNALKPEKYMYSLRKDMERLGKLETVQSVDAPRTSPSEDGEDPQNPAQTVTQTLPKDFPADRIDPDGVPVLEIDLDEILEIYGKDAFDTPYDDDFDLPSDEVASSDTPGRAEETSVPASELSESVGPTVEGSASETNAETRPQAEPETTSRPRFLGLRILGWVEIPAINFSIGVTDVPTREALALASVLHSIDKHSPGQEGTSLLYQHRSHSQGGDFSNAHKLKIGDTLILTLSNGASYTYRLEHQRIESRAHYWESLFPTPTEGDHIIVITCDPPGSWRNRILQDFVRVEP